MAWRDESWLSLTPEPERLLPAARAALRSAGEPAPGALAAERAAAERLVLRARRTDWEAWLRESVALAAASASADDEASALVREVVANHDALALGLPGAERRSRRR